MPQDLPPPPTSPPVDAMTHGHNSADVAAGHGMSEPQYGSAPVPNLLDNYIDAILANGDVDWDRICDSFPLAFPDNVSIGGGSSSTPGSSHPDPTSSSAAAAATEDTCLERGARATSSITSNSSPKELSQGLGGIYWTPPNQSRHSEDEKFAPGMSSQTSQTAAHAIPGEVKREGKNKSRISIASVAAATAELEKGKEQGPSSNQN